MLRRKILVMVLSIAFASCWLAIPPAIGYFLKVQTTGTEAQFRTLLDQLESLSMEDSLAYERKVTYGLQLAQELNQPVSYQQVLLHRARLYLEQRYLRKSLDICLNILNSEQDPQHEIIQAEVHHLMGNCHYHLGTYDSAVAHYHKGLNLLTTGNDLSEIRLLEATLYRRLGHAEAAMSNHIAAEEAYHQAVKLHLQRKDAPAAASIRIDMARLYARQNLFESAHALMEEQWSVLADSTQGLAYAYKCQGIIWEQQKEYEQAMESLEKSLVGYTQLGRPNDRAEVLTRMGRIDLYTRHYTKAIAHYQEAFTEFAQVGNRHGMALNLNNLGQVYMKQGNFVVADSLLRYSLQYYDATGNLANKVYPLYNLATLQEHLGRPAQATPYYRENYEIWQSLGDTSYMAETLALMSINWIHQDSITLGEAHFEEVQRLFMAIEDYEVLYPLIYDLADKFRQKGYLQKGLDWAYQGLALAERFGKARYLAYAHAQLGDLYVDQGELAQAEVHYLQALPLFENSYDRAVVYLDLAELKQAQEAYTEVMLYARQAFSQNEILGDSCQFASCNLLMGQAQLGMTQTDSAMYFLQAGKQQAAKCMDYDVLAEVLLTQGHLLMSTAAPRQAQPVFEEALHYAQQSENAKVIQAAAEALYPLYANQGNFEGAYATLLLYQVQKDSLFNAENTRALVEKELTYEHEKELQTQALLQQQQKAALSRQRWIIYTTLGASLGLLVMALSVYRNFRLKQKANQLLQTKNDEIAQQKAELERLDEAKSRFYSNLSHELRTPLTLINSPLQQVLRGAEQELSPHTRQYLQLAENNTHKLALLVDDLLDLSKLESATLPLRKEPTQIQSYLRKVKVNFDSLAKDLEITLTVNSEAVPDAYLALDKKKLNRVLENLLSNALKYTPAGGNVTLTAQPQGATLQLQVADTGAGIPAADLPRVFDRYYQSQQPNTALQGGTGIGLALAKELAQLMGGTLAVQSTVGEGSTFTLTLPYRAVAAPATIHPGPKAEVPEVPTEAAELAELPAHPEAATVLVVEDNAEMRTFLRLLLGDRYTVKEAIHGKKALELLETEPVDLVLSDVMMPEMDGYALLEHLKQDERYVGLPVVMLTALGDEQHKLQALTTGVDDYLSKPFSPAELLARVDNLIHRQWLKKQWIAEAEKLEEAPTVADSSTLAEAPQQVSIRDMAWLREVEAKVKAEMENDAFQIGELADEMALSMRQFQRKMKALTGLTPKQYQQEIALQRARELLEALTYDTPTAVAYSVGMNNVTRFSQLYERRFGKKPQDYFIEQG